jgi:hypothetical protein
MPYYQQIGEAMHCCKAGIAFVASLEHCLHVKLLAGINI